MKNKIRKELLDELLAGYRGPEDMTGPDGLLKRLTGALVERPLAAELTDHLGHDPGEPAELRCLKMPSEIGSLRSVMEAGADRAAEVLKQDAQFVREFFANEELFKDRAAFEAALGR